jgi:hypothetical protein
MWALRVGIVETYGMAHWESRGGLRSAAETLLPMG